MTKRFPNARRIKQYLVKELQEHFVKIDKRHVSVFSGKNWKTHIVIHDIAGSQNFEITLDDSPGKLDESDVLGVVEDYKVLQSTYETDQLQDIREKD